MSPTPVCAYSLAREGTPDEFLNYDGSNLLRCSRCKGVWYVDQDAQKNQWKIHKKSCTLLNDDAIAEINRRNLERIGDDLMMIHRPGGYPDLYYILKRLRKLYYDDVDGRADSACHLHGVVRGILFHPLDDIMMLMVSSPHIANYLFGDEEDLLNPKTRLVKYDLASQWPSNR